MQTQQSFPIEDKDLDVWRGRAEGILRDMSEKTWGEDLEDILKECSPEESWRVLPIELALLFDIRQAMCFYFYFVNLLVEKTGQRADVEELRGRSGVTTPQIQAKLAFNTAYALFVMGSSIAGRAEKLLRYARDRDKAPLPILDTHNLKVEVGRGFDNDLRLMLGLYVEQLKSMDGNGEPLVRSAADSIAVTRDFWKAVSAKAVEKAKEAHADCRVHVERVAFRYNKFVIRGFSLEAVAESKVTSFPRVEPNEVVGDEANTFILMRLADRLALYDPAEGMNPFHAIGGLIESILIDGPPGTGKTRRQQMLMTRVARRAEQVGVPFHRELLTADQVKSEWYGKTAGLLAELIGRVRDPSQLCIFSVDDIDLIIKGNRDEAKGADLDIMEGLMRFFAGVGADYCGNYIAIAATNKPTGTDDALRQRFIYRTVIEGPKTAFDFADLAALELRRFGKTGKLRISVDGGYKPLSRGFPLNQPAVVSLERGNGNASWGDIGEYCEELQRKDPRFTARSVRNAILNAVALASEFDVPEEWFANPASFRTRPWEERVKMVADLFRDVTATHILAALKQQFESEVRYVEEERKRRLAGRVEEIHLELRARNLAVKERVA